MNVSVVIPVYNEERNVAVLADELNAIRPSCPGLEAVFVDDGSRDGTWAEIEKARARYPFVRGIRSPENRGQSSAMLMGLKVAGGDVLVTLDGDLQNNPADIPRLVGELKGFDVVCGYRASRKDTWSKRAASKVGNMVRNGFTHDGIRDTGCTLKAFRRQCLSDLPPLNGVHRFMPAYFKLHGRTITQVPVDHRARRFGASKYTNLKRLPRTLADLMGFVWYRKRLLRGLEPVTRDR